MSITSNPDVENALEYVVNILLVLSMFGCFCTILTFIIFSDLRTYPIKLIIYLCLSILFAQVFFYVTFYVYDTVFCIPCAMILHYFFIADFIWTFCVAFNFYQMIVRRNRDAESLEKIYHVIAWLIPMFIVATIAGTKNYWNRGGYCYMDSGLPIFLGFFLPGLIIVSANAVIFFFIAREIHDTLKSAPKADKQEKWKEVRVYFSIFVSIGLSWFFGFVMVFIDQDVLQFIFLVLFSVFTPLQGFLIFISYCVNAKIAYRWASFIGRGVPWFRRFESLASRETSTTASSSSQRTNTNSTNNKRSNNNNNNNSSSNRGSTNSSSASSNSASSSSTSSSRALI
jgi:hypothetical protein